jgi:hypothetical protein
MAGMYSRLAKATLGFAGGALAVFHGWLFAAQAVAGRLEDPWLIFRWLAALALVGALVAVRRGGDSIWGRKGIAVWVLAALLHGPAAAGDAADPHALALPEAVATTVLQLVSTVALALGLWLLGALLGARRPAASRLYAFTPAFSLAGRLASGVSHQFSPRPPPLRS